MRFVDLDISRRRFLEELVFDRWEGFAWCKRIKLYNGRKLRERREGGWCGLRGAWRRSSALFLLLSSLNFSGFFRGELASRGSG